MQNCSAASAPALSIGHRMPGVPFTSTCQAAETLHGPDIPLERHKISGDCGHQHPEPSLPRGGERQGLELPAPHHQGRGISLDLAGQGGLLAQHSQDGDRVRCL